MGGSAADRSTVFSMVHALCFVFAAVCGCLMAAVHAAIPADQLWQWYAENRHNLRDDDQWWLNAKLMKTSLVASIFETLTGGAPVSCGGMFCTVCFCWPSMVNSSVAECLTAGHVDEPKHGFVRVNISGVFLDGHTHLRNDAADWMSFIVADTQSRYDRTIDLMHGFDTVPVVSAVSPHRGDAVWKVGFQSGVSVGRIVDVLRNGTFVVDGMRADHGDSGAAICHADDFSECKFVGMLTMGSTSTQHVVAYSSLPMVEKLGIPLGIAESNKNKNLRLESDMKDLQLENLQLRLQMAEWKASEAEKRTKLPAENPTKTACEDL